MIVPTLKAYKKGQTNWHLITLRAWTAEKTEFKCKLEDGRTLRLKTMRSQEATKVTQTVAEYLKKSPLFHIPEKEFNTGCVLAIPAEKEHIYFVYFNLQQVWKGTCESITQFVVRKLVSEGINTVTRFANLIVYKNKVYLNDRKHGTTLRIAAKQNLALSVVTLVTNVTEGGAD